MKFIINNLAANKSANNLMKTMTKTIRNYGDSNESTQKTLSIPSLSSSSNSIMKGSWLSKSLILALLGLTLTACGGGSSSSGGGDTANNNNGGGSTGGGPTGIGITNFKAFPSDTSVRLTWTNPNATIANFTLTYNNLDDAAAPAMDSVITTSSTERNGQAEHTVGDLVAEGSYSFAIQVVLGGADENKTTRAVGLSRTPPNGAQGGNRVRLGANPDGNEYIDAEQVAVEPPADNNALVALTGVSVVPASPGVFNLTWTNPSANDLNITNITVTATGYTASTGGTAATTPPIVMSYNYTTDGAEQKVQLATGNSDLYYTFSFSVTLGNLTTGPASTDLVANARFRYSASIINPGGEGDPTPAMVVINNVDVMPAGSGAFGITWMNDANNNKGSHGISIATITVTATGYTALEGGDPVVTSLTAMSYDYTTNGATQNVQIDTGNSDLYYEFSFSAALGNGTNIASVGSFTSPRIQSPVPDTDSDGLTDDVDVDDDNDGLIEISDAAGLNAMRFNLEGTSLTLVDGGAGNAAGCGQSYTGSLTNIVDCAGYELMANIDLAAAGFDNWEPIGTNATSDDYFVGDFEGNGNVIDKLNIDTQAISWNTNHSAGLFGASQGDISNLQLRDVTISAPHVSVGALVGVFSGGSISNVSVSGDAIAGGTFVGGLIGRGGEVGGTTSPDVTVNINNVNIDLLSITGGSVGGLAGVLGRDNGFGVFLFSTSDFTIGNSKVVVNQIAGTTSAGGLIGGLSGNPTNIYAAVAVADTIRSSSGSAGGLIGEHEDTGANAAGLHNLYSSMVLVANITSFGDVGYVGGLIGEQYDSSVIRASAAIAHNITAVAQTAGGLIGLVGQGGNLGSFHSLALTNIIRGEAVFGELFGRNSAEANASYWQNDVELIGAMANSQPANSSGQPMGNLTNPANAIFNGWKSGGAGWCNPATGEYLAGPPVNQAAPAGYETVWNLDTNDQYPALNCLPINLAQQRGAITRIQAGQSPVDIFRN